MTSQINILLQSAIPEATKVSTACAELTRRWKTTSAYCSKTEFERITKTYMDNLTGMGYTLEWKTRIIQNAVKGYCKVLLLNNLGITKRNRPGHTTRTKRRYKKLIEESNWFQKKVREDEDNQKSGNMRIAPKTAPGNEKKETRNEKTFSNVMFVTHTKESKLKKAIQRMKDALDLKERVKYVEKSGINLSQTLVQKDPWKGTCGREECLTCESSPGVCSQKGVVHQFS